MEHALTTYFDDAWYNPADVYRNLCSDPQSYLSILPVDVQRLIYPRTLITIPTRLNMCAYLNCMDYIRESNTIIMNTHVTTCMGIQHGLFVVNNWLEPVYVMFAAVHNNVLDGPFILYSIQQELCRSYMTGTHMNGLIHGSVTVTPTSHNECVRVQEYDKGLAHGKSVMYNSRNIVRQVEFFNHGQLHGLQRLYYENGQISQECSWVAGKRNGAERHWLDNGLLVMEINYFDDLRHGLSWCLNDDDTGVKTYNMYEHGVRAS